MLYLKEQPSKTAMLGIWQIDETEEQLWALVANAGDLDKIRSIKSCSRRLEKLASRLLLNALLGDDSQVAYYPSGRPYLVDNKYNISISHTKGYVAIIVDTHSPVAIDIEQIANKVKRVRSRLVGEEEYIDADNELNHLLLHWSAKEAMYKLLDRADVDFLRHLQVQRFTPSAQGVFHVQEFITDQKKIHEAVYSIKDDFVLVYIIDC